MQKKSNSRGFIDCQRNRVGVGKRAQRWFTLTEEDKINAHHVTIGGQKIMKTLMGFQAMTAL